MTDDERSKLKALARKWRKTAERAKADLPNSREIRSMAEAVEQCARELDDFRISHY